MNNDGIPDTVNQFVCPWCGDIFVIDERVAAGEAARFLRSHIFRNHLVNMVWVGLDGWIENIPCEKGENKL
jgi:hypothetical protein